MRVAMVHVVDGDFFASAPGVQVSSFAFGAPFFATTAMSRTLAHMGVDVARVGTGGEGGAEHQSSRTAVTEDAAAKSLAMLVHAAFPHLGDTRSLAFTPCGSTATARPPASLPPVSCTRWRLRHGMPTRTR